MEMHSACSALQHLLMLPISAVMKIKPREITNDFQTFTWIENRVSLPLRCSFFNFFLEQHKKNNDPTNEEPL